MYLIIENQKPISTCLQDKRIVHYGGSEELQIPYPGIKFQNFKLLQRVCSSHD